MIEDAAPELVEVLSRRSDGNPFFALEMARLLAAKGELNADAAEALVVPDGIADVLRLRFQRLGPTRHARPCRSRRCWVATSTPA